ncbi:MAG: hypothetical protein EXS14_09970 [Planctomycetes bacterium]|nr:hypothetical protein [Planctomycetota bacterium]
MRSFGVSLAVAAFVVGAWILFSESGAQHAGSLPDSIKGRPPTQAVPPSVGTNAALVDAIGLVAKGGDLGSDLRERGVVGAAILDLLQRTRGMDVRALERSFAQSYNSILLAWEEDPARIDADVAAILRTFDEVADPAFRYALSWLFEKTKDDRFVDALVTVAKFDPQRGLHALGNLGTQEALLRVRALLPLLEDSPARILALQRLAAASAEGAASLLRTWALAREKPDIERIAAVESLGVIEGDAEAMRAALEIALGPAIPLRNMGDRSLDHEHADLRSAAVLAIMRRGDMNVLQDMLARADEPGADSGFRAIVDAHVHAFQGSDITQLLIVRAGRRRRVSYGEAAWFNNHAVVTDVHRLREIEPHAADARTRELLQAAISTAATRQ